MGEFLGGLMDVREGYTLWRDISNPLPFEFLFWMIVLLVTGLVLWRSGPIRSAENWLTKVARKRRLSVLVVFLLALCIRAALLPWIPIPEPSQHDEFSYLLQSDTFASGRLTNPAHVLPEFFETYHVNVEPTYQSMYPPAQAAFLAAGQRVTGVAWLGVWISIALMCAAICWMLQAWMPPPWPLVGALACILRFDIFSYWVNSYWGGAVAAFGGALVVGAAGRLRRKLTARNSLLLALGLALLANSRPWEGLVLSVPVLVALLLWARRYQVGCVLRRAVVPAALVLGLTGAFMLYYNWRGTGHPLLMPYTINQKTYHFTNMFVWQKPNPIPYYDNEVMRKTYLFWEMPDYIRLHSDRWGIRFLVADKLAAYYAFFVWPLLLLLIPTCWELFKSSKYRLFPIVLSIELVGLLVIMWPPQAHYPAPVLGVLVAIFLLGLRLLRTWRPHRIPIGMALSRATIAVLFCWALFLSVREVINPYQLSDVNPGMPHQYERARLKAQLERLPGKQLVFVHSRRDHFPGAEWVYNRADIDKAKIVWARDMGSVMDADLIRYYPDRHVWIVDQDDGIRRLTAYNRRPALEWSSLRLKMEHEFGY